MLNNHTSSLTKTLFALGVLSVTSLTNAGTMGPIAAPTWSGFYAGLNAGAIWQETDFTWSNFGTGFNNEVRTNFPLAANATLNSTGFIGGGQIGGNYQYDNYVFGLEADLDYTSSSATRNVTVPISTSTIRINEQSSMDWLSTIRARLGFAQNEWLFFGTGGLALSQVNLSDSYSVVSNLINSAGSASTKETRFGWTAGGGLEWKFAPQWSAKVEYLYVDLGNNSYSSILISNGVPGATGNITHNHKMTANIARVGVNYFW